MIFASLLFACSFTTGHAHFRNGNHAGNLRHESVAEYVEKQRHQELETNIADDSDDTDAEDIQPHPSADESQRIEQYFEEIVDDSNDADVGDVQPHPSAEERQRINQYFEEIKRKRRLLNKSKDHNYRNVVIDTIVHVVHHDSRGNLRPDDIVAVQKRINKEYNPYGFAFDVKKVTYTNKERWFTARPGDQDDQTMRKKLNEGDSTTLNLYFRLRNGANTYPWNYKCYPEIDGVSVDYRTIPGGSDLIYNQGKTIVHNIGQWLGLYKVFSYSCDPTLSDEVDDTPVQRLPTEGCPELEKSSGNRTRYRDTCRDEPGRDNIHNFMDFSDDACRTLFTPGQAERMHDFWRVRENPEDYPGSCVVTRDLDDLTSSVALCFSPSVIVDVERKGRTAMSDIQVGDKVLTSSGEYKSIFTIDHFHKSKPTRFIQIHTTLQQKQEKQPKYHSNHYEQQQQEEQPLEITRSHMVFVLGKSDPVLASSIKVGDYIRSYSGNQKVTNITTVIRNGLYNPITTDGTIVADGLIASTYSSRNDDSYYHTSINIPGFHGEKRYSMISSQHDIAHMAYKPYGAFCLSGLIASKTSCSRGENNSEGLAGVNKFMNQFYVFYSVQNDNLKSMIMFGFISLFGSISFMMSYHLHIVTIVLLIMVSKSHRSRTGKRRKTKGDL